MNLEVILTIAVTLVIQTTTKTPMNGHHCCPQAASAPTKTTRKIPSMEETADIAIKTIQLQQVTEDTSGIFPGANYQHQVPRVQVILVVCLNQMQSLRSAGIIAHRNYEKPRKRSTVIGSLSKDLRMTIPILKIVLPMTKRPLTIGNGQEAGNESLRKKEASISNGGRQKPEQKLN